MGPGSNYCHALQGPGDLDTGHLPPPAPGHRRPIRGRGWARLTNQRTRGQLWSVQGNWAINHVDTKITTLNTEINVRHYNIIHPDHSDTVIMNEVNHGVASRNVFP